jgi:replicative DNA helicase
MARPQTKKADPRSCYAPPADPEAEQSVLGAILVRPEVLDQVADILDPADFYREAHGRIFRAILDLYGRNEPVDYVTVTALLKDRGQLASVGGAVFIVSLSNEVGFAVNAPYYAKRVREKAELRRLLDAAQEIASACLTPVENVPELLDAAEAWLYEVSHRQMASKIESVGELARLDYDRLKTLYHQGQEAHGLLTGFYDLDKLTGGLYPGDVNILAARPCMGKTALALNIAWHAGHSLRMPVAVFSLEMPKEQLIRRIVSSAARIDGNAMKRCLLSDDDWAAWERIQADLQDAQIYLDDRRGLSALDLKARCRRIKARHGLSLVIVDYLQLMREPARARSRDEAVSSNAYSIKELAGELGVPILVCCQVNREIEKDKRKKYRLSDLRESGGVEQAADNIWFLWRDEEATVADLTIGKQRNGPVGSFRLTYSPAFTKFDSYASS